MELRSQPGRYLRGIGVGAMTLALSGMILPAHLPASSQNREVATSTKAKIRVGAAQMTRRTIKYRLNPSEVLAEVDKKLGELETIVHKAGEARCDALALPEDTLGLLDWGGMNEAAARHVLPEAVKRMIDRLGRAAASHRMYLVVCSDVVEKDGAVYDTAFFLGRDGKEIGRYHKTCPTWWEYGTRKRGTTYPVFPTKDLGTVGMLICNDLKFPEPSRCLALQGADIVFFPTMGGGAYAGEAELGVQALRVRAVENFVWLVVAQGDGAMIISPQGKIVTSAARPDGLVIADIDPFGGREGGDSFNSQHDMRGRLFRERNPSAFGILTDPNPPVLAKSPINMTKEEAGRIMVRALTVGEEEFNKADALARAGKTLEAIAAFEKLCVEYRDSWIDRVARERLAKLRAGRKTGRDIPATAATCIAAKYPGDKGIETDPAVLFHEDFEGGDMRKWDEKKGPVAISSAAPHSGAACVEIPMHRGRDTGGHLIKWFLPGADTVFARFYLKFSKDYQYNHHFVWLLAGPPDNRWAAFGKAGAKPDGSYFSTAMEPWFAWGKNPPPGEVNLYTYYPDMEKDPKMDKYWGNGFFPPGPGKGAAAGPNKIIPPLGRWQCWEFMLKANSAPDKADGEQAMWVDGKLAGRFTGLRWRTRNDVKVNCLWLEHYGFDEGDPTRQYWKDQQTVWFDDIVVSTRYVGPVQPKQAVGGSNP